MPNNKIKKDIFVESVGRVKKLKKSNKNFNKITTLEVKKTKIIKKFFKPSVPPPVAPKEDVLKIEKSSIEKKLKKGKVSIDKTIDFHGLSIVDAKRIFIKTIDDCFYSNKRCILFITGKGINHKNNQEKGKLFHGKIREQFQTWVHEKAVVTRILSIAPAGPLHGGDGAFFVYLRKNKF